MENFRGLTGEKAKLEFFLAFFHELNTEDESKLDKLFNEAEEGNVLPSDQLKNYKERARKLLPILGIYQEAEKVEQVAKLRDDLSEACGI